MAQGVAAGFDAMGDALGGELRTALRLHKRLVEHLRRAYAEEEATLRRTAPHLLPQHVAEHRSCVMALFQVRDLMKAGAAAETVRAALAGVQARIDAHDDQLRLSLGSRQARR